MQGLVRLPFRPSIASWLVAIIVCASITALAQSDHTGKVTLTGVSIPGATVTAKQGDKTVSTITDQGGVYKFTAMANGTWTVTVTMVGFETMTREVTLPSSAEGVWELSLLPIEKVVGALPAPRSESETATAGAASTNGSQRAQQQRPGAAAPQPQGSAQRAVVNQVSTPPPPAGPAEEAPVDPTGIGAAAGLLINGSVNNAATSPFAQARAFGTNRPNQRSLFTYAAGMVFGNSSWDARPYSFTGTGPNRPDYTDAQFLGSFQGPVRVPGLRNRVNVFVNYLGTADHNATSQSSVVPTLAERLGDFSNSLNAAGQPIQVIDPTTGLPFPGNVIEPGRISPQAAALLAYYPLANADGRRNYQTPILSSNRVDSANVRLAYAVNNRNQLQGTIGAQRTEGDSTGLFGFTDDRNGMGLDLQANWSFRISQFLNMRSRYQYIRNRNTATPYFANRTNVAADAGIAGTDQDPLNWGPPRLQFASDLAGLSDGLYSRSTGNTHVMGSEIQSFRGRHTITAGGEYRRISLDLFSQQDPRGSFSFTGARSGSDFADFLLGLPQTASIAYGNADKFFRSNTYAAYVTDDWRLSPSFTMNIGVRWEYESPISERLDRLVNLDVAPDFTDAEQVLANAATGAVTGAEYPRSLVRPDKGGFQPRLGIAWRPVPGSSLVVRAGYGVYRNSNIYQSIATQLAQQAPLSTSFSIGHSLLTPLTLADGLLIGPLLGTAATLNTFAVDPDLSVGFAQNWQASVQRDLPMSLTVNATYLGSKGSNLLQAFVPNTYPIGAINPCPACPTGFRYLISGGRSIRHAGQVQLRRRLRNGFTSSIQYTLAKAMDNAGSFSGASINPDALAQNWLDLEAEYARSNFDQRHQVVATFEYTTGAGILGGTLMDGMKGALFKDWTFTSQITTGSGTPVTASLLVPVGRTGIIGTTRPSLTGVSPDPTVDTSYANIAAFTAPATGEWGNAPRNFITGPSQFSMNASVARTFRVGERVNMDFRIDATNVLNRVTFNGIYTQWTPESDLFGFPRATNDMRRLRTSVRFRF
ncbi:MAG TPA: TonB-dependent receptor [Vicinamibacterales bacterium]|nr:TonB-dependent receptor [Vicinamibacterales bacterium]